MLTLLAIASLESAIESAATSYWLRYAHNIASQPRWQAVPNHLLIPPPRQSQASCKSYSSVCNTASTNTKKLAIEDRFKHSLQRSKFLQITVEPKFAIIESLTNINSDSWRAILNSSMLSINPTSSSTVKVYHDKINFSYTY